MIYVYLLPVLIVDGAEQVAGLDLIHHALLQTTESPDIRLLIQDVTPEEHVGLSLECLSSRDPTTAEILLYHQMVTVIPPNPDIIRARQLLGNSPEVISQPEMWELMRIFGRLHGIDH